MRLVIFTLLIVLAACARAPLPKHDALGPLNVKAYESSAARIANPERGFYHHSGDCDKEPFEVTELARYRTSEQVTLVMCVFYLKEFRSSPISQAQLTHFAQQAAAVRKAGLKMVLRFAYTKNEIGDDAPLWRIKSHLSQLAPYLKANNDVIAVVQSGFVGTWGEGYYTRNFGNEGVVSPGNWVARKAVVDELLRILPSSRSVQLRTPKMKRQMYGSAPVSSAAAFSNAALARLGHHNDSFLSDNTDQGTYSDVSTEYPYLRADTLFTPMGGESNQQNPPRSSCPTALTELKLFHYSYLNRDFEPTVLKSWQDGGCLPQVERQLGYRFSLLSTEFPASVRRGASFTAKFVFRNAGWAGPFGLRAVELVLRETTTRRVQRFKIAADPRRWAAGKDTVVAQSMIVPTSLSAGTYELLLALPDPDPSLRTRTEYAIQLANTGVWEATTGLNRLQRTIRIY